MPAVGSPRVVLTLARLAKAEGRRLQAEKGRERRAAVEACLVRVPTVGRRYARWACALVPGTGDRTYAQPWNGRRPSRHQRGRTARRNRRPVGRGRS